ncbi:MAG: IS110 family transposase [Actinobacteria bacterium]|nr:IS110 family transposase [Actinomycetota bacterium]MCA1698684.1 IS110 family transposase [Actinomycetota bacterium]
MRAIGLDVHLDFCEVAIVEGGALRSSGRIATTPEQLELFAGSLGPDDRVALEVCGNAWEIARIIEPHVARVVVVAPGDTGIRQARAKTDRLDARTLARLLASGELDAVWVPDHETWVMRRRLARRGQLVWARSRAKNQIHAVLMRRLIGRPPVSDLFGVKGRRWLASLELPIEERESVDGAMRQIEFLDSEIAAVERLIAKAALGSPQVRRLMTVPGVNVIVAASFLAAIGDIRRFPSSRKLVGYLGLDPRVRQSGTGPATHGHISKQGSVRARHALVEASWSAVRQPGPTRAFYQRIRARRGHQVAVVAAARKLCCLFWCLLTREEDYAFAQPSLTRKKLRRLELTAGAPSAKGTKTGLWAANAAMRQAERDLARQAESAYQHTVREWQAAQAAKAGASATPGRASQKPTKGKAARQTTSP